MLRVAFDGVSQKVIVEGKFDFGILYTKIIIYKFLFLFYPLVPSKEEDKSKKKHGGGLRNLIKNLTK